MQHYLPITTILSGLKASFMTGWSDLGHFANIIMSNPPTPLAMAIGLGIIAATFFAIWGLAKVASQFMHKAEDDVPIYKIVAMKQQSGKNDMFVELTSPTLISLDLLGQTKIRLIRTLDGGDILKETAKVYVRKTIGKSSFTDENISMSDSLKSKLRINDGESEIKIKITQRALFPFGIVDWTVNNPDQNTSLSWRMLIISTAVGLVVSVIVSQYYYELSENDGKSSNEPIQSTQIARLAGK